MKEETPASGGSNDFVKKLFQMLSQDKYLDVVRWTPGGNSFVVLDTNEFTKVILPTHFKHSNFASFVRQLNKYDFHKVKIPTEEKQHYQYGDDAWEFQHPDFRKNDKKALDNIRRKAPTKKESGPDTSGVSSQLSDLRSEVARLRSDLHISNEKFRALSESAAASRNYNERSYRSMGVLVHCLNQAGIKVPPLDLPNPSLLGMVSPPDKRPSGSGKVGNVAPPVAANVAANVNVGGPVAPLQPPLQQPLQQPIQQPLQPIQQPLPADTQPTPPQTNHSRQHSSDSGAPAFDNVAVSTYSLPDPKYNVLLVEDDNVCIQLCRKFLMKYGCQVTVVTDGLNAISTVEHSKYDLVLMDIVMPNLDGATATSIIRSFDTKTPIIAMTGNIQENDLVTYLQNGMSDILAKPFTKDDLYSILSKYLLGPKSDFQSPPVPEFQGSMDSSRVVAPPMNAMATPQMGQGMLEPMESMEQASKKQRMH